MSGSPISLLKFPWVAKILFSSKFEINIELIISLVVVLPLLPVIAITKGLNFFKIKVEISANDFFVSSTNIVFLFLNLLSEINAAIAPFENASSI